MSNGRVSSVASLIRATIFLRAAVATGHNGTQERDGTSSHGDCEKSSRHSMANYKDDHTLSLHSSHIPYILAYKSLSRISCSLKIESVCGPKSLTRV